MKNNNKKQAKCKSIAKALDENLEIKKPHYSHSAFRAYRCKTEQLKEKLGKKRVDEMNATKMELFVAKLLKTYKGNTVNHYLDILRQIFDRAEKDGLIAVNPMSGIKKCKFKVSDPDPFLKAEISALLQYQERYPVEVALIKVGITTGLRISELLALSCEAVDLKKRVLYVDLALVTGKFKAPKTEGSQRTVELSEQAVEALQILIAHASKRKAKVITVTASDNRSKNRVRRTLLAYCTDEKRLYASVDDYRETFFKPYCQLVSVRYRGPSQFRHTFASQLLSSGISAKWISRQMGHASTAMIERHYAKWLTEDAADFAGKAEETLRSFFGGEATKTEDQIAVSKQPQIQPSLVDLGELMANPAVQQLLAVLNQAGGLSNDLLTQPVSQSVSQSVTEVR